MTKVKLNNSRYLIKTPTGFKNFYGIQKKVVDQIYSFYFDDGSKFECSSKHLVLTEYGFIKAKDVTKLNTITGKKINTIKRSKKGTYDVFDPIQVEEHSTYFANGIISHNTEFLGSSNTLIGGRYLANISYDEPIAMSEDYHTKVYEQPRKDRFYILVADPAEGTNKDNSAIIIFDITELPYRVVLTYTDNQISPVLLPSIIKDFAERYNGAVCLIEVNNQGAQVANILYSDLEYDNVIQTAPKGRSGLSISGGYTPGARLGIRTTSSTKMSGCGNLKTLIEHQRLMVVDFNLYEELTRFTLHGKSYRAEEGTDDLVMCCVLFGWFQTQDYIRDNVNIDLRRNLYEANLRALEDELVPVGIIDDGRDQYIEALEIQTVVSMDEWLRSA